jgi:hypothetical protein
MRRGAALAGLALILLAGASPAVAAGGPRVIDDAAVETPGVCHVETWLTASTGANRLYQFAPACTPRSLPMLEVGGSITQTWAAGADDTVVGAAAKVNLVDETQRGWGVAVSGGIGLSIDSGEVDNASSTSTRPGCGAVQRAIARSWASKRTGRCGPTST